MSVIFLVRDQEGLSYQKGAQLQTGHLFSFASQVSMQVASYSWPHFNAFILFPLVNYSMHIKQDSSLVRPLYHMRDVKLSIYCLV